MLRKRRHNFHDGSARDVLHANDWSKRWSSISIM
jgi:hypothetical protein